jgi:hypothetical protein
MSIYALIHEIHQGERFTDAQLELALRWVAELGRPDSASERVALLQPAASYRYCARLARLAARFGQPGVITAIASSPIDAVRASLAEPGPAGTTPAFLAAVSGHVDVIQALAAVPDEAVQASLGASEYYGRTPSRRLGAAMRMPSSRCSTAPTRLD